MLSTVAPARYLPGAQSAQPAPACDTVDVAPCDKPPDVCVDGRERIVEQQMKFGPELPAQIRKIWTDGKARFAEGNGAAPDPVQFAMIFVDRNFGRA